MPFISAEGMKLLIAEDERNLANVLRKELTRRGNDVTVVYDGPSGQRAILSSEYDIVLLDIMLPVVSGLDLCELAQRTYPDTVVIIMSAMTDIEYAVEALRRGAFDYMTKPFDFSTVEMALQRAARHRILLKMNRQYERHLQAIVSQRSDELIERNRELKNAVDKLYRNYEATLRSLALALETRGAETKGHFHSVALYCNRLGAKMGLSEREMLALEQGAWMHDIGKIGVPDGILSKPGPLTDPEWVEMRRHVEYGAQIVRGVHFLESALQVIEQHHERYDGAGYPKGLRGHEICLLARIFSVVDALDTITSDRPYRAAQSFEAAKEELVRCSGTQFDPAVIEAFLSIPLQEWKAIRDSEARPKIWSGYRAEPREVMAAPFYQSV